VPIDELAARLPRRLVSQDAEVDGALVDRLADSSALAIRLAYGVLRQHADAEDVAQEAFARAAAEVGSLRDRERFRGWLVRITWRLAIDRQRSERRRDRRERWAADHPTPAPPDALELTLQTERREQLWQAIDALPEHLRGVVVLSAIEELDVRTVAAALDVPEGTVKSRLHAARKRLAESLRCLVNDTKTT
jgi:RNA polymerase sigma-70 factor, ECF subfamily